MSTAPSPPAGTASPLHVLGFAGSLRRASYNRALLRAAVELAPKDVMVATTELADLPLFDEDVRQAGEPPAVSAFKRAIAAADALLIATPEYNRSFSGVLKNAIDWASRPVETSPLMDKPVAIMGASGGPWGTTRAQMHLRHVLAGTGCLVMIRPELYVARASQVVDADGNIVADEVRQRVHKLVRALTQWTHLHKASQREG